MRLSGQGGRARIEFLRREHRDLFLWRSLAVMLSCKESSAEYISRILVSALGLLIIPLCSEE